MSKVIETEAGLMLVEWDVPIEMDDGMVLRGDVFRPMSDEPCPVLLSYGPYGKGLPFQEGYETAWERLVSQHPEVADGSSNRFQSWEVADPERWVPHGYACVRVDSRGAGRSPGQIDHFSPREIRDLYMCIEWAGTTLWSNGKVGLSGISYYAAVQWQVAALRPPHLAAICPWEGFNDMYREATHHGGILSTFTRGWARMQVQTVQYGNGRGLMSTINGLSVTGDEVLDAKSLRGNRIDFGAAHLEHAFDDEYYAERRPDLARIEVPVLSAGNWGGAGLHLRGNIEGFLDSGSSQKWLEIHGLEHWTEYYTDYGRALQQEFFDHFLKGEDNGWDQRPPVMLKVRQVDGSFDQRTAEAWPLPGTAWTDLFLNAASGALVEDAGAAGSVSYDELGDGVTFYLPESDEAVEVIGPLSLKLFVSSTTDDADLFAVLRIIGPDGEEITFPGALDPHSPPAQGWLRASHRELDPERSLPYRPYHPHQRRQPLEPEEVYEVDIEIWPTCIVLPPGYRMALTIQGHDYEYGGAPAQLSNLAVELRGSGPLLHDDPIDRPVYDKGNPAPAAKITVHTGGDTPSRLLVPFLRG
ncbi:CocE/NonD family hydrolase [Rhodococcus rhodochrous]|uniref:CocE/NonD family hydrolase n=1 Tax=Rhodococcus rhodochrous TaxID=1829 RepID=UPI0011ACFD4D|nr:CocE/NonD family hydrolase [Rhodococcus rhodochrous]TWH44231.1 hypothetical protein L612_003900000080 [Rhodococcus rhodochrous J38]